MTTERTGGPADGPELPASVVEDILDDPRRRRLLRHLAERQDPVAVTDLAAAVGAAEAGRRPADVSSEVHRSVRADIFERHLPKLTATGVVEYDSMRGTVSLCVSGVAERVS